jgi:hypothetical protein
MKNTHLQHPEDAILTSGFFDNHKYYVYVYYNNDMVPYYIGKGCGTRISDYHGSVVVPEKNYRKKIKENLCEEESFVIESQLIRHFGRKVDGGILENVRPGARSEEHVENFYHQKRLYDESKEKSNQYLSSLISESNVEWESELHKLRHIKNNCPEEWNRIYLAYCADYYDEDREEQVKIILNENENQPAISEITR